MTPNVPRPRRAAGTGVELKWGSTGRLGRVSSDSPTGDQGRLRDDRDFRLLLGRAHRLADRLAHHRRGDARPRLPLTGSPALTALTTTLDALPYLLIGLFAGALSDRWNRKRVMVAADLANVLVIGSVPVARWLGVLTVRTSWSPGSSPRPVHLLRRGQLRRAAGAGRPGAGGRGQRRHLGCGRRPRPGGPGGRRARAGGGPPARRCSPSTPSASWFGAADPGGPPRPVHRARAPGAAATVGGVRATSARG